jgi:PKD repeat protein/Zn-dependent metalloprotease
MVNLSAFFRLFFASLLLVVFQGGLFGQQVEGKLAAMLASKEVKVVSNKEYRTPMVIECLVPVEAQPEQWLNSILPLGVEDRWVLVKSKQPDKMGFVRHELKQMYRGVEVEDGQYFVFEKQGKLVRAVGKYVPVQLSASAGKKPLKICRNVAIDAFLSSLDTSNQPRKSVHAEHENKLMVVTHLGKFHYAYRFIVSNENPHNNQLVYIDAQSGKLIKMVSDVHGSGPIGTANTTFYGVKNIETTQAGQSLFFLNDESRNIRVSARNGEQGSISPIYDTDNVWEDTSLQYRTAQTAMWVMQEVHDIVSAEFDFTLGYDSDAPLNVYVAASGNESYYTAGGIYITFSPTSYTNAMVDLVGHELMHWFISQSSNLAGTGEALAISESLSDIFGTYMEHRILGQEADYLIASERTATGIRNLSNPKSKGHADSYLGQWYNYSWNNTQLLKYQNGGVMNYWFYLLSEGGEGVNDFVDAYQVDGIGIESAFRIVQRMESMYLISTATFEDAMYASQIAAQDLFGECSNELIQVTRAWAAVNIHVDEPIVILPPIAEFEIEPFSNCTYPLNVQFVNWSSFADSYLWDFGDGTTSTEVTPNHTFASGSNYTVTLIAEGLNVGCSVPDTVVLDSLFSNLYNNVELPEACPVTLPSNTATARILEFQLGNFNNQTPSSPFVGYSDFSCSHFVEVYPGDQMKYKIRSINASRNLMWLDFNNDGNFLPTDERVIQDFVSPGEPTLGYLTVPEIQSGEFHARIRLTSGSSSGEVDPCAIGSFTETEDYRLVVKANPVAPEAAFEETKQYTYAQDSIAFRCLSTGGNLQRSWTFEGGIPAQSNSASPVVVYSNPGVYAVKLVVTNAMGVDSLVKTEYIRILESVNLCSISSTNLQEGFLFDNGGPGASNVGSYLNCGILIEPQCVDSIVVKLNSISGLNYNNISLHAGESALDSQITLSASTLGQNITIPGDKFFFKFSNGSNYGGNIVFEWHGYQSVNFGLNNSASNIIASDTTLNLDETWYGSNSDVDFVQQSQWDFGDGNEAVGNEVIHQYAQAGSYVVSMETTYCDGVVGNTARQVEVMMDANAAVTPVGVTFSGQCYEDTSFQFTIQNSGVEDLHWQAGGYDQTDVQLRVLFLTNSVDTASYLPILTNKILYSFPSAIIETTTSLISATIAQLLNNIDVVVLPKRETASIPFSAELIGVLQSFVEEGGRLIQIAPSQSELTAFGYVFSNYAYTGYIITTIVEPEPYYTAGFENSSLGESSIIGFQSSDAGYISLLKRNINSSIAGYRQYGFGRTFFLGGELDEQFSLMDSVFARMVGYSHLPPFPAGISYSNWEGIIPSGGSSTFTLQLNGLIEGEYSLNLPIVFNGDFDQATFIPVSLDIAGVGDLDFSANNLVFNNIPAFSSNSQFHYVINSGCDTIYLDSVDFSNPYFLASYADTMIVPGDSTLLEIESQPLAAGNYTANLILHSDIEELQVLITLNTVNSGGVVLSTPELNFSISNCESQFEGQFLVTNHSDSTILADISSFSLEGEQIKIGIFSNTLSTSSLSNVQQVLSQELENIEIQQIFSSFNTECNALILGGSNFNSIDEQALWNYVLSGGNLVFLRHGSLYSLNQYDLLEATAITSNNLGSTQGTVVYENGFTNGYENGQLVSFPAANTSFTFADTAYTSFINTISGQSLFGIKEFGEGRVVYLGSDYSQLSTPLRVLLKSTINQFRNLSNQQLVISPSEFELAPGAQQLVDLSFVPNNISEGVNQIGLEVSTNDLAAASDTLLLNLNLNSPPCADFTYSILCNNNVEFVSSGINGESTTYLWTVSNNLYFSSSNSSLVRFYTPGTYTTTLRVCNSFGCDTSTQQFIINLPNSAIPAACLPVNSVSPQYSYFKSIQIGNLNHTLIPSGSGYTDYSCDYFASHVRGDILPFEIKTSSNTSNKIAIWIDYDNNGAFNNTNEFAYSSINSTALHTGFFPLAGSGIVYGVPLRMRVLVKSGTISSSNYCQSSISGQYIDYVIYISESLNLPVTEFIGTPLFINVGETVSFENQSTQSIFNTYQWIFPGGNPSSSTLFSPQINYPNIGQYNVTLISSNLVGSDTLVKSFYVTVADTLSLCGTDSITTYDVGSLYDSGGPSGTYQDNENCSYLIQPICADTIVLTIDILVLENNYDFLNIYDGTSASDPLIYSHAMGDQSSIYALSGSAFVRFTSDASYAPDGFEISWETKFFNNLGSPSPFNVSSNELIVFEEVFLQSSILEEYNSVLWDFGDGSTSSELNTSHYYDQAGTYIVSQSIELCGNSYFFSDTIVVGGSLEYTVSDQSFEVLVGCANNIESTFNINNTGTVDLQWELNGTKYDNDPNVVYLYRTADSTGLSASMHMLADSLIEAEIYALNSNLTIALLAALDTTEVIVVFKGAPLGANLNEVILNFIQEGGTVIYLETSYTYMQDYVNVYSGFSNDFNINVNPNSIITEGMPEVVSSTYGFSQSLIDPQAVSLFQLDQSFLSLFYYKDIFEGRVYYIGYSNVNAPIFNQALFRSVKYNNEKSDFILPNWLEVSAVSGEIEPGEFAQIDFDFTTDTLPDGVYDFDFVVSGFDYGFLDYPIHLRLIKNVQPCPDFTYNVKCNGEVLLVNISQQTDSLSWIINGVSGYTGDSVIVQLNNSNELSVQMLACNEITCVDYLTVETIPIFSQGLAFNCTPSNQPIWGSSTAISIASQSDELNTNLTLNATSFYNDYSCNGVFYFKQNVESSIEMQFNQASYYAIYIDKNGNASFDSGEMLTSGFGSSILYSFNLGNDAVTDSLFKLRLLLDDNNILNDPCTTPQGGTVFDFLSYIVDETTAPIVNWSYSNLNCSFNYQFQNNSILADSYVWNFGDGNSSNLTNPLHTFAQPGNYTVVLTASNLEGTASYSQEIEVVESTAPVLEISGLAIAENALQFSVSEVFDNYFWEFSTGQTSFDPAPVAVFPDSGFYQVSALVGSGSCFYSIDSTFRIDYIGNTTSANFNYLHPECGQFISFFNLSQNANSYSWNFGDGTTSSLLNPSHTFQDEGNYTVSLTANGLTNSDTYEVNVGVVNFDEVLNVTSINNQANYTFSLDNNYSSYYWTINDVDAGFSNSLTQSFPLNGLYEIQVTVEKFGCYKTFSTSISIVTGIEDAIEVFESAHLYPNPTLDESVLEWSAKLPIEEMEVAILDLTGRVIQRGIIENIGVNQFRTSIVLGESAGVYLVRLSAGERHKFLKLVKTN